MNPEDVIAVIQTYNEKGENCGVRVLASDLNEETKEKLKDMKEAWDWDFKCLADSVDNWISLKLHLDSIATMNNPDDDYCKEFDDVYKKIMKTRRTVALDLIDFIHNLEKINGR